MSGANSTHESLNGFGPNYQFTDPGTLLFITGVPLSGKSTISPHLAASIEGCSMQNMDIFRLLAQTIDALKPEDEREPALQFGSCDGYLAVGDGSYSPANLLTGFGRYSRAVFGLAEIVIPSLEAQGAQSVLFEGVQLQPSLIEPHLKGNSKLVIVTSSDVKLKENRDNLFGGDPVMNDRYSTEKLLVLQDELVRQGQELPADSVLCVENTGNWKDTLPTILDFLQRTNALRRLVQPAEPIA